MFTLTIPTGPVESTDEHHAFVLATMLRDIADRIGGPESAPMRETRDRLPIDQVALRLDQPETHRYATRFNATLVGAAYEITVSD